MSIDKDINKSAEGITFVLGGIEKMAIVSQKN